MRIIHDEKDLHTLYTIIIEIEIDIVHVNELQIVESMVLCFTCYSNIIIGLHFPLYSIILHYILLTKTPYHMYVTFLSQRFKNNTR